jgi:nucleotide-binding universal stress UspA family protein
MYKTLVVALDLEADGDRALPIVKALSNAGKVAVDLVTVSSPGLPSTPDAYELEHRARSNGWDADAWSVVHDIDVAGGLLQHVARHEDPLLVMATSGRAPWSSAVFGGIPHDVLRRADRPVLLIGPHVPWWFAPQRTTLVACLDAKERAARAIPSILSWQATFATDAPHLAEVISTVQPDASAQDRLDEFARMLAAQGIHPDVDLLYGDDPIVALERAADRLLGAIYVATSARYTDGRLHWHSTTRDLVHRATKPVLVVPARPSPLPLRLARTDPAEHVAFHDVTVPATIPSIAATTSSTGEPDHDR